MVKIKRLKWNPKSPKTAKQELVSHFIQYQIEHELTDGDMATLLQITRQSYNQYKNNPDLFPVPAVYTGLHKNFYDFTTTLNRVIRERNNGHS